MEITSRALWTLLHGMGFGVLYLMGCSGMLAEFYRRFVTRSTDVPQPESPFFKTYLLVMTLLGWFAVLSGTYVIYPWFRAIPPAGTKDIKAFPQKFLISDPRKYGRPSSLEDASVENANVEISPKEETSPQAALPDDSRYEAWYHAKYGRSSPLEAIPTFRSKHTLEFLAQGE